MTQLGISEAFSQRRTSTVDLPEGPAEHEGTTGSIATVVLPGKPQCAERGAKFEKAFVMVEPSTMPIEFRELAEPLQICEWGRVAAIHIGAASMGSVGFLEFAPASPGALGLAISFDSHEVEPVHLSTTNDPEDPRLRSVLDRASQAPAATVGRASALLAAAHGLDMRPDRVAVTRSSGIAITFMLGRRYAIFECDTDGDVVLTLTDRTREREADTYVVEPGQEKAHLEKAAHFLGG